MGGVWSLIDFVGWRRCLLIIRGLCGRTPSAGLIQQWPMTS